MSTAGVALAACAPAVAPAAGDAGGESAAPAGYDVAWPSADETMNYRPALGYSKYY